MKATVFSKLQNLLHIGMKPRDRDTLRDFENAYYMTPDHVVYVRIRMDTEEDTVFYNGAKEGDFEIPKAFVIDTTVCVRRDYLLEALKNMDSENVKLQASTDRPLIIEGSTGEAEVDVWIAPRIENE